MREQRYFKTSESEQHTLAELIDKYNRDIMPGKALWARKNQIAQLAWWRAELGAQTMASFTPAADERAPKKLLLAEARDKLSKAGEGRKTRSPATVNRYLAALSHVFTVAVKEWGWMNSNPLLKVTKPKEPRGRVRWLSDG